MKIGLRFIGVMKTAIKKYPMGYLTIVDQNESSGQRIGVVIRDKKIYNVGICMDGP